MQTAAASVFPAAAAAAAAATANVAAAVAAAAAVAVAAAAADDVFCSVVYSFVRMLLVGGCRKRSRVYGI